MTKLFQSNDVSIPYTNTLDIHTLCIVVNQSKSRNWKYSLSVLKMSNAPGLMCDILYNVWTANASVSVAFIDSFSLWGHLFFCACLIMLSNQYKWCHITNKFKLFSFFILYEFWCLSNGSINISVHLSWICLISPTKVNYAQLLNYNYC